MGLFDVDKTFDELAERFGWVEKKREADIQFILEDMWTQCKRQEQLIIGGPEYGYIAANSAFISLETKGLKDEVVQSLPPLKFDYYFNQQDPLKIVNEEYDKYLKENNIEIEDFIIFNVQYEPGLYEECLKWVPTFWRPSYVEHFFGFKPDQYWGT